MICRRRQTAVNPYPKVEAYADSETFCLAAGLRRENPGGTKMVNANVVVRPATFGIRQGQGRHPLLI